MTAPSTAARTNAAVSTDQSRGVLGPSRSGGAGSSDASIAEGAVCAHHLYSQNMFRAYRPSLAHNTDESRRFHPPKGVDLQRGYLPFGRESRRCPLLAPAKEPSRNAPARRCWREGGGASGL